MNVTDSKSFSNISASTALFYLKGGVYSFRVKGTITTSVALQALLPDGSSLATVNNVAGTAASVGSGGSGSIDGIYLPPGQYQITLTSATAVFASVASTPL